MRKSTTRGLLSLVLVFAMVAVWAPTVWARSSDWRLSALTVTGSISGTVTVGAGVGLGNTTATAYAWTGSAWQPAGTARTIANGSYTISGLAAGDYKVGFTSSDLRYLPEYWNDVAYPAAVAQATSVALAAGDATTGVSALLAQDLTAPVTSANVEAGAWYADSKSVQLTATDAGSGIASMWYRIGTSGGYTLYITPISITTEGATSIYFYSIDAAGNTEGAKSASVQIDKTPPATTSSVDTASASWYKDSFTAILKPTDARSGVAATYYQLNGGAVTQYTVPFAITTDGADTLSYWSVDRAGKTESPRSASVKIDSQPPASTATAVSGSSTNGWSSVPVIVTIAATDYSSGVSQINYQLGLSSKSTSYTAPISVTAEGVTTVLYRATDKVGHMEPQVNQIRVQIDTAAPTPPGQPTWSSVTPSSVTIRWPQSTDLGSGISYYRVMDAVTANQLASSATTQATLSGLTPGVRRSLVVQAVDGSGRISGPSEILSVNIPNSAASLNVPTGFYVTSILSVPVPASPTETVSALFDWVDRPGVLSCASVQDAPASLPPGHTQVGRVFVLDSTAISYGRLRITLPYDPTLSTGLATKLRMLRWNGSSWEDVTASVDTAHKTVLGTPTRLGPFVLVEPAGTDRSSRLSAVFASNGLGYVASAFGQAQTITGRLTDAYGTQLAGRTVTLQQYSSTRGWFYVRRAAVGTQPGEYRAIALNYERTSYRLAWSGDAFITGGTSSSVRIHPNARLTWTSAPTSVEASHSVRFVGRVYPSRAGRVVALRLWHYENGAWVAKPSARASVRRYSAYSTYTRYLRLPSRGRWRIIAVMNANDYNPTSQSSPVYVRAR